MYLMENDFLCEAENSTKEEIAIDIQLANVVEDKYGGRNVMIWVHGDFFNHIGFYTSLYFKGLHVKIAEFTARYILLPEQFCDNPM